MRVVVTGGSGFIGGETVLKLLDAGHSVFAIDRVWSPDHLEHCGAKWLIGDFAGEVALRSIETFQPDAIIHCAGTSLVGPSMLNPQEYYDNNFVKTKILCDFLVKEKIKTRLIFSSSAATYGNPIMSPCQEVDPTEPISPYGESKLMIEWLLKSYQHAYGLDYVAFRYFNACGADSQGRHGQKPGATHIIARVLESIHQDTTFTLNGDNFETPDGTCIRDYIHVEDLADAHIAAIDSQIPAGVYNLGTATGHSNREVIDTAEKITGQKVSVTIGPIRSGDPAILTADSAKFINTGSWQPQYQLQDMINHAWQWHKNEKNTQTLFNLSI
jgi:UDP-glucose 4-epimerase